jgi:hypothetical protein
MKFGLRTLLVLVAVAAISLALLRMTAQRIRPSVIYSESATFEELPADDAALENWLGKQPGVVRVYVTRKRNSIEVTWLMSRDLLGHPPIPELQEQFGNFGYQRISHHIER